uniref:Uncharacterized protein n=1 Tax=Arion vulgaris TaxID=1028688 RepID=A0A0B7BJV2_9EUPU
MLRCHVCSSGASELCLLPDKSSLCVILVDQEIEDVTFLFSYSNVELSFLH